MFLTQNNFYRHLISMAFVAQFGTIANVNFCATLCGRMNDLESLCFETKEHEVNHLDNVAWSC